MLCRLPLTVLIVSAIFVTPCLGDIDYSICNPLNYTIRPPPPPALSKSYLTRVEWKWLNTGTTVDTIDLYNGITDSGSLEMFIEGQEVKLVFDYDEDQYITYKKADKSCIVKGLGSMQLYDNKLWLTSLHLLYSLMKAANVEYMGEAVVRSTNTTWFQTCLFIYQSNITVEMNIYFSAFGWGMAFSRPDETIPVRIELIGSKNSVPFHVVGDFTDYNPSPVVDESIMQVPPGTFCTGRRTKKPLNILPNSFSVVFETVNMDFARITYESIWFDAKKRLVRRDYKEASGSDPDPTSEIFDFNLGIHYNIDQYMGSCDPITYLSPGDLFVANNGNMTIRMKTASEFFHAQNTPVQYIGSRTTRGVSCDVWVGLYLDDEANMNFTIEWYFTKDHWVEAVGGEIQPAALFRMDIWQGGTTNPIVRNVLQFNSEAPTQDVFDVAPCFTSDRKTRLLVHFAVLKGSVDSVSNMYLKDILHTQLVSKAFLPPLRISKVSVQLIGQSDLYMDGVLLDTAPLINPSISPSPPAQHSLRASYAFLDGVIRGKWRITVNSTVDNVPVLLESRGLLQLNYVSEFTTTALTTKTTEPTPPTPSDPAPTTVKPLTPTRYETPPSLPPLTSAPSTKQTSSPSLHPVTSTPCQCTTPVCPTQASSTPKAVVIPSAPCPTVKCPPVSCPTVSCPTVKMSSVRSSTVISSTVTNRPNNIDKERQNKSTDSSSGLSNGATAAVALVMLIVGLFFGVVMVFVYKRIRGVVPIDRRNLVDKYLDNEERY